MFTTEQFEVHLQPMQEKFVKISLLQHFFEEESGIQVRRFRKVGELQGRTIGGSLNIANDSPIRRTCSLELVVLNSDFLISPDSQIWIDKWFGLEIGIRSLKTGNIVSFDKGVFAINNPSIKYDRSTKILNIEGLDLMSTMDGTLGGSLGNITKIPNNVTIEDAIRICVHQLGKIPNSHIFIEHTDLPIPFDIEKSETDTIYSLLEEIRDLYKDWEMFFDVKGRFIYRRIQNRNVAHPNPNFANDVVVYKFLEEHDLAVSYDLNYQFSHVKNKIVIWGRMLDSGIQIHYELENDNPDSPFSVNKNLGVRLLTIMEDNIQTLEQAQQRARYELYKHNNMLETVTLECVPLYFLGANQMIEFDKTDIGLRGKYLIDTISVPLGHEGTMSISAHRVYEIE